MKVFLGSAVWRSVEVGYHDSVLRFADAAREAGVELVNGVVVGDALVSRSRSIVASAFVRSDCDILLTIDSDIIFRAQDALTLCRKAMDKYLVGALYMTRNLESQPALMLRPYRKVVFGNNANLVEAEFLSTGFMAVHRSVFEKLKEGLPHCHQGWKNQGMDTSFWPFYMPYTIPWEGDGHMYLSEDWAFVQRAKEAGFTPWLDPSIRVGHIGTYTYTLEDLIRSPRPNPLPLVLERDKAGRLSTNPIVEPANQPSGLILPNQPKAYSRR